ncbi:MAG: hypothetical protein ACOC44_01000 [Promethearchaeia archaeon]
MLTQLSVFLKNEPGTFSTFLDLLIDHDIEIRAVTVAENNEWGLLLLLVDKPRKSVNLLDEHGYSVSMTRVIAVKVPTKSSNALGLKRIAETLGKAGVNIDFLYSTLVKDESLIILKVSDDEKAINVLEENDFNLEKREAF